MAKQKLKNKEVNKLMSDCEAAGGDFFEVDYRAADFYAESGPTFRAICDENGQYIALVLVQSAGGMPVHPAIPVTVDQAYALSDLERH